MHMAIEIRLRHEASGLTKTGYVGFSWTTFFFGLFPALFRGDFITFIGGFVIYGILFFTTFGVGAFVATFIWAFFYNSYYTKKLIERGYILADTPDKNRIAAERLGIRGPLRETLQTTDINVERREPRIT